MVLMLMEYRYEKKNTMMFQKKKKIELVFVIGLPANETQFSKTAITKYYTFFSHKLMLMLVNINGNGHRQIRCVL